MSRMPVVAALAAALATGALLEGSQDGRIELTLAAKVPNPKAKAPLMRYEGAAPLPDLAVLFLSTGRSAESWVRGTLSSSVSSTSGLMSRVEARKFRLDFPIDAPGVYSVKVDLRDELQFPKVLQELVKLRVNPKNWNFEFLAWSDDYVLTAAATLQDIQALSQEALEMVKAFEEAVKSEETWKATGKKVTADGNKTLKACQKVSLRMLYPAALSQINSTVQNVHGAGQYYTFEGGKFAGATSYHADNQKIKSFRDEAFDFVNFKRYLVESLPIAGREFGLWIIKDFRRSGNQLRPDAAEALKQVKAFPGVADFVERLLVVKAGDELDVLERDIRGTKAAPGTEKKGDMAPKVPEKK